MSVREQSVQQTYDGRSKSFATRYDAQMAQAKFFILLCNMIARNNNTYVTFMKKLFNGSQIEFLLHAVQARLSTHWPV